LTLSGCGDQSLGPDQEVGISLATLPSDVHTHSPFTPVVKVVKWTEVNGAAGSLSGLAPGTEITMKYKEEGETEETSVTLQEVSGTGIYLGSDITLLDPTEYEFEIEVTHEGATIEKHVHVEAEKPHSTGLIYKVKFETNPAHIHAGIDPATSIPTPVDARLIFQLEDPDTGAVVTGLSDLLRIHVQDPSGRITADQIDTAGGGTGEFLAWVLTESSIGTYEAIYTFPGTLDSNRTWHVGICVDCFEINFLQFIHILLPSDFQPINQGEKSALQRQITHHPHQTRGRRRDKTGY